MSATRHVYVISDLHLGGVYPSTPDGVDRGFRICTHVADLTRFVSALAGKSDPVELVINGDMVDFLAERDDELEGAWQPFVADQHAAARRLETIIERDRMFFDALAQLGRRGHRLTVLLGNHDIELALPLVRERFAAAIGASGEANFRFIYDGEGYAIGNALIEHGNRYDKFNVVDHDGLRQLRSLLSRRQHVPARHEFSPPAGSRMVADVINPIKADYRFIDLLKPETATVLPILLALEPGYRRKLRHVAAISLSAMEHTMATPAMPSFGGDIHAAAPEEDPLRTVLSEVMADPDAVLNGAAATDDFGGDIAAFAGFERRAGLARLLLARETPSIERRLPAVLAALRSMQTDTTFALDVECFSEYLRAAEELASGGFDYVVFGHTHAARDVRLGAGSRYLNSGTWADVIRFPREIVCGPEPQALAAVRAFVEDMRTGRLAGWISFMPTYVRLDVDAGDHVIAAALCEYSPATPV